MSPIIQAVVAGHICLDIIPNLDHLTPGRFETLFQPGRLIETGPVSFSTGGPVSNTGLALHRLGISTRLIAKVGNDQFGQVVRDLVSSYDPNLINGIVVDSHANTSYTVIISPPGVDRIFLHCPGANDTFTSEDINYELVSQASLFHFGYPPIMRHMYQDGGSELAKLMRRAHETGATTSLDLAFPDPSTASGMADWRAILKSALPYVDIFLPSIEELLYLLRYQTYAKLKNSAINGDILSKLKPELLSDISDELLEMGVKIAVLKLGERGLYLRTANHSSIKSIGKACPADPRAWADQELWVPCFQVSSVGSTGAGDATIAGFLSALLRSTLPEEAMTAAVAVGACNVEAADALSGIRTWEATLARIADGWPKRELILTAPGWRLDKQIWRGPSNR